MSVSTSVPRSVRYIVDGKGKRSAVVLDIEEYEWMREQIEDLEDIRAFDAWKAAGDRDDVVPIEEVFRDLGPDPE